MENTKNNNSSSTSTSGKSEKMLTSGQPGHQGKGSKLKRAFSLSRNPFHSVSRQTGRKAVEKLSGTGTPAAAAALGTMTNASVVTSEQNSINSGGGGRGGGGGNGTDPKVQGNSAAAEAKSGSERKIFRRLSVKKFINRIAQQMTYVNLAVSGSAIIYFFILLDCFCVPVSGWVGVGRRSSFGDQEKPEQNENGNNVQSFGWFGLQ